MLRNKPADACVAARAGRVKGGIERWFVERAWLPRLLSPTASPHAHAGAEEAFYVADCEIELSAELTPYLAGGVP